MLLGNDNLVLRYYKKSVENRNSCMCSLDLSNVGYSLLPGQNLYLISYRNTVAANQFLKYDIRVLDVTDRGIKFSDMWNEVYFYEWEKMILNCYDQWQLGHLYISPCSILFEKMNIKKLLSGQVDFDVGIWYKHGGHRVFSKYEKNLKNFVLLGQQELVV